MNLDFATEWETVIPQIKAYIGSKTNDRNDVDDVVAETGVRALRGYDNFQRRSSFLTWVLKIADRELIRLARKKRWTVSLDHTPDPVQPPQQPLAPDSDVEMRAAVEEAVAAELLARQQADVILMRLEHRNADWEDVGLILGLKPNHCAVLHYRGVIDLRVYLFVARPRLLGGLWLIQEAFAAARSRRIDPLTDTEAAAFQRAVLDRSAVATVRGVLGPLRLACTKVALELDVSSAGA